MENTLLLNASYEPIDIVSWQRAITLWCQGKVETVHNHDKDVRSVKMTMKLPAVVRLLRYIKMHRKSHIQFSRANIYARDHYVCQYCRKQFKADDLTFDHVIPFSRGGPRTWDNIVTCCLQCNRVKGDRTPEEARMKLMRVPKKPLDTPAFRVTMGLRHAPESWKEYLFSHIELDSAAFIAMEKEIEND